MQTNNNPWTNSKTTDTVVLLTAATKTHLSSSRIQPLISTLYKNWTPMIKIRFFQSSMLAGWILSAPLQLWQICSRYQLLHLVHRILHFLRMKCTYSLVLQRASLIPLKRHIAHASNFALRVLLVAVMSHRLFSIVLKLILIMRKTPLLVILRLVQSIRWVALLTLWTTRAMCKRWYKGRTLEPAQINLISPSLLNLHSITTKHHQISTQFTTSLLLQLIQKLTSISCWKLQQWMIWSRKCRCRCHYSLKWARYLVKREFLTAIDKRNSISRIKCLACRTTMKYWTLLKTTPNRTWASKNSLNRFANWRHKKSDQVEPRKWVHHNLIQKQQKQRKELQK